MKLFIFSLVAAVMCCLPLEADAGLVFKNRSRNVQKVKSSEKSFSLFKRCTRRGCS